MTDPLFLTIFGYIWVWFPSDVEDPGKFSWKRDVIYVKNFKMEFIWKEKVFPVEMKRDTDHLPVEMRSPPSATAGLGGWWVEVGGWLEMGWTLVGTGPGPGPDLVDSVCPSDGDESLVWLGVDEVSCWWPMPMSEVDSVWWDESLVRIQIPHCCQRWDVQIAIVVKVTYGWVWVWVSSLTLGGRWCLK